MSLFSSVCLLLTRYYYFISHVERLTSHAHDSYEWKRDRERLNVNQLAKGSIFSEKNEENPIDDINKLHFRWKLDNVWSMHKGTTAFHTFSVISCVVAVVHGIVCIWDLFCRRRRTMKGKKWNFRFSFFPLNASRADECSSSSFPSLSCVPFFVASSNFHATSAPEHEQGKYVKEEIS